MSGEMDWWEGETINSTEANEQDEDKEYTSGDEDSSNMNRGNNRGIRNEENRIEEMIEEIMKKVKKLVAKEEI